MLDNELESTKTAEATALKRGGKSFVPHALKLVAAVVLGLVVASGVQYGLGQARLPDNLMAIHEQANLATSATAPNRPAAVVVPPRLGVAIVLEGRLLGEADQFTLPPGSVFALKLRSNQTGTAEIYAINPEGVVTKLWRTRMDTNQAQSTPELRLQGEAGDETLRIVFQPDASATGVPAATLIKQINIAHE